MPGGSGNEHALDVDGSSSASAANAASSPNTTTGGGSPLSLKGLPAASNGGEAAWTPMGGAVGSNESTTGVGAGAGEWQLPGAESSPSLERKGSDE